MSEQKLDMPKTYDPQSVESRLYEKWESEGLFKPAEHKPEGSKPFCIVMPPPARTMRPSPPRSRSSRLWPRKV